MEKCFLHAFSLNFKRTKREIEERRREKRKIREFVSLVSSFLILPHGVGVDTTG